MDAEPATTAAAAESTDRSGVESPRTGGSWTVRVGTRDWEPLRVRDALPADRDAEAVLSDNDGDAVSGSVGVRFVPLGVRRPGERVSVAVADAG